MRSLPGISVVALLLMGFACTERGDDDGGPNPDPDPGPGAWLVGDQGTMFAIDVDGQASTYPLERDDDLRAIACLGEATAWVVGSGGTVLRSRDAGQRWDDVAIDGMTSIEWTALAVAEASIEPLEVLWLVGGDGAIVRTADGGASWTTVAGTTVDFTGVATTLDGSDAIAVADDGSIWQIDATGATSVHHADGPLHAVALAVHGGQAIAVGADGRMLASEDAGASWLELDSTTDRDLHAVRVAHDGGLAVAVGEAGIVVRASAQTVEAIEWPDAEFGLYALHLRHDGRGQAVGGNGVVLSTDDAGLTWTSLSLPTTATLRGVDDFHVGGHL